MKDFFDQLPPKNSAARQSLYQGQLYLIPALPESLQLVSRVLREVERLLGADGPFREAQFRLSEAEFFNRVGQLRRYFYTSPESHDLVRRLIQVLGFLPVRTRLIRFAFAS